MGGWGMRFPNRNNPFSAREHFILPLRRMYCTIKVPLANEGKAV